MKFDLKIVTDEFETQEYIEKLIKCHKPTHVSEEYRVYNINDPYIPGLRWVISIEKENEK